MPPHPRYRQHLAAACLLPLLVAGATGCASKTKAQMDALNSQKAYLAGQNDALQQQINRSSSAFPSVTVLGHVQNATVPWVAGLTLTQALATANYLDSNDPVSITVTRRGNVNSIDLPTLFNGPPIPLEPGDTVEIR